MNHIFTKLLCGISLGMACVMSVAAEDRKAVVVISTDGSQREEVLENIDRIELGATSLTLKCVGGSGETVDYSKIDRMLIGAEWTAIKKLTAPGEVAVWPLTTTDAVNVSGLTEGETVTVFDLKGVAAAQAVASEGVTSVSLSRLPAGVYVVTARKQSVKIIKK